MIHVGEGTQPMTEVGRLDANLGWASSYPPDGQPLPGNPADQYGEIFFRSSILDAAHNAIYIGTDSRPGQVIKIAINQPQLVSVVSRQTLGVAGTNDIKLSHSDTSI